MDTNCGAFVDTAAIMRNLDLLICSDSAIVHVAAGELLDKISILQIRSERITDEQKLTHVQRELAELWAVADRAITPSAELASLTAQLKQTNEHLWDIENEIRVCEARQEFGPRFVELARAVYTINDQRTEVKRRVNALLGSELVEQKEYSTSR